jgi:hypothetical protein
MIVRPTIFESDEDADADDDLELHTLRPFSNGSISNGSIGFDLNGLSLNAPIMRPEHGSPAIPMSAPGSRSTSPAFGASLSSDDDDDSAHATATNVANQLFGSRSLFSMPESEQE